MRANLARTVAPINGCDGPGRSAMFTRRGVAGVLLTSALTHSRMLRAASAQPAQSWPSRGVRIICPVAAGGAIDAVTARGGGTTLRNLAPAGCGGEPNRRQQQYRGGSGRPRPSPTATQSSPRLRAWRWRDCFSVAWPTTRRRLRSGLADLHLSQYHGGAQCLARALGDGIHRLRQGERAASDLRIRRPRHSRCISPASCSSA